MQQKDLAFLYACIMGDGCLYRCKFGSVKLAISHCTKQLPYLQHKVAILSHILDCHCHIIEINNSGYPGCRWAVGNTAILKDIYTLLYPHDKKCICIDSVVDILTPESLAILWMDDGSMAHKKRNGKIHAREGTLSYYDSYDNVAKFCKLINVKFDLDFQPVKSKGQYRMRLNTAGLKKLIQIIHPYIIPAMFYKIDLAYD